MDKKRVYVAGHRGMVGSALCRLLQMDETVELVVRNRDQIDLTSQQQVHDFFCEEKIDEVYLAAARVGGILANSTYPVQFIMDNLSIQLNIIGEAYNAGISKLLFLGSSCIYPRDTSQPMQEKQLLTGELEPTNEPYAIAKIAGIKMCEAYNRQYGLDYRSVMPTNLYGPGDNFHPENSHVVPGMIRRFHEAKLRNAKEVVVWGSGKPRREFLHVDDMAAACLYVMQLPRANYDSVVSSRCSHINVGTGMDCSIRELAELISEVVGFEGDLVFDTKKPDGTPRKLLDVSRLNSLGWRHSIDLTQGLEDSYSWFVDNHEALASR